MQGRRITNFYLKRLTNSARKGAICRKGQLLSSMFKWAPIQQGSTSYVVLKSTPCTAKSCTPLSLDSAAVLNWAGVGVGLLTLPTRDLVREGSCSFAMCLLGQLVSL